MLLSRNIAKIVVDPENDIIEVSTQREKDDPICCEKNDCGPREILQFEICSNRNHLDSF
jgi:hypothetical protein